MAEVPVVICFGSSNWEGLLSKVSEVPEEDYKRLFGTLAYLQLALGVRPYTQTMPGVKMWTNKTPFARYQTRDITSFGGGGTTVTVPSAPSPAAPNDSWCFVATNESDDDPPGTNVQGQLRKVSANGGTTTVSVSAAFTVDGTNNDNGTILFFTDSYCIGSVTADGVEPATVTRSVGNDWGIDEHAGKFVVFYSGGDGNVMRRIVSNTTTQLTLDDGFGVGAAAIGTGPAVGTGFQILAGTPAGADSLATFAQNAEFRDLQVHLDTAPVSLTGFDKINYNLQSAITAGSVSGTPFNAVPQLMWEFRSRFAETIYGVSIGIDSATISPQTITPLRPLYFSWQHDVTQLDFHPSSPTSLWTALITAIDSMEALIVADGNTMKVVGIFDLIYENECLDTTGSKVERIGDNATLMHTALRDYLEDDRIPIVMIGPSAAVYENRDVVYEKLQEVVDKDPFCALVETRPEEDENYTLSDDEATPRHWTTASQIHNGKKCFEAWATIQGAGITEDLAVEVCNLALANIGNKAKVTSIFPSDGSPEADYCATYFPRALKAVLGMHAWKFALEKRALVVVNADDAANDDLAYLFRYEIPLNSVKEIAVVPQDAGSDYLIGGVRVPIDFTIKRSHVDKRVRLYTNEQYAHLRYVAHETDLSKWDELAIFALSWHLASLLCGSLIKSETGFDNAQQCLKWMAYYLAEARSKDSNERQVTLDRPAAQIQARK